MKHKVTLDEDRFDLTPMIDVVFLMLIYFMSLDLTQEADLGIQLPTPTDETVPQADLPVEILVEILPDGTVLSNGAPMDHVGSRDMPQLVFTLQRLKATADSQGVKTLVTIAADDLSPHQRSIDVLNACAVANLKFVSFALGADDEL